MENSRITSFFCFHQKSHYSSKRLKISSLLDRQFVIKELGFLFLCKCRKYPTSFLF